MDKTVDIFVCGYLCVDLTPAFKTEVTFQPGTLTELNGMTFSLGGAVGNTGLVLHRFGKKVLLNGLIGDDHLGRYISDCLDEYGVANSIQKTTHAGTAFGIVLAPPAIDRLFLEYPGSSRFFDLARVDIENVKSSKLLHFGYLPLLQHFFHAKGEQLVELFQQAKRSGTVTSMDLSLPDPTGETQEIDWHEILTRVLPHTDILLPSIEEILYMTMPDVYRELCEKHGEAQVLDRVSPETIQSVGRMLLRYGVKIVLIKMAHRGAYLFTGNLTDEKNGLLELDTEQWSNLTLYCPAYAADRERITNASGAGDTAVAAFLAALLEGVTPQMAVKLSTAAGRESLYCNDLYTELPDWEDIYHLAITN